MTAPGPRRRLLRVAALGVSVSRCEMLRDSVKGRARERAKRVCVILGSCSCRVFGSRSTFSRSRTLARCRRPTRRALPCPAPPRGHACTRVAHVWPTHARTHGVPPCRPVWPGGRARPRRAVGQAGLGSLLPGRACLGDALRLSSPPGRPFPSLSGHLPRTLSVGLSLSPRSPSRAPGPAPPAGPSAPHARPWPTCPAAPVARASARRVASLAEDERGSSSPDPGGRLVSHPRFGEYSLWSSFFP